MTDHGTAPPASDTLIVNPTTPIGLLKSFAPDNIAVGGVSLLTITVNNPNTGIPIPVGFVDLLPSSPGQMVVATGPAPLINTCGGTLTAAPGSASVIYEGGLLPIGPSSCSVTVYVTAAVAGDYINTLGTAVANLTVGSVVNDVPTITKTFTPSTINAGGISTVTIILTNPGDTDATLTAPFIDTLPSGLVVAGSGANASTTSGTLTAITGQSTVTLTGGSIPANGSVIIKFDVYAAVAGSYVNTLPSGSLQTSNGNNSVTVVATLIVNPR
ncbi:MAG: hypothetical protein Q7U75_20170, partial [Desulfobacterales bacterium]|nr:hypothetical protein [Desulfobacterales bacterium]